MNDYDRLQLLGYSFELFSFFRDIRSIFGKKKEKKKSSGGEAERSLQRRSLIHVALCVTVFYSCKGMGLQSTEERTNPKRD